MNNLGNLCDIVSKLLLSLFLFQSQAVFGFFIRGTHNQWQATPMLCYAEYGLGRNCAAVLTLDADSEIRLDLDGDGAHEYGVNTDIEDKSGEVHFIGEPVLFGDNIRLRGGKTYYIFIRNFSPILSIQEIEHEPTILADNIYIRSKKTEFVTGSSSSITIGEILVRPTLNEQVEVGVLWSDDGWQHIYNSRAIRDRVRGIDLNTWHFQLAAASTQIEFICYYKIYDDTNQLLSTYWDAKSNNRGYALPANYMLLPF